MSASAHTLFSALPKITLGPVATEFQMRSMRQKRRINAPYLHDYQVATPIIHEPPSNTQMLLLWIRPLTIVILWFFAIAFTLCRRYGQWTQPSTRNFSNPNSTAK